MFEIKTQIIINSPIGTVWSCLMETEKYSVWNKFIHKVDGRFSENERVKIEMILPSGEIMQFSPVCTKVIKNSELRWVGNIGFDWIFKGEHYFILEPTEGNKTRLTHAEKFTGILCWLFKRWKADLTKQGFEIMNANLSDYINSTQQL